MAKQQTGGNIQPNQAVAGKAVSPPCELLERMRKNPQGDWSIRDVETLCGQTGLTLKSPTRGSHYKVTAPGIRGILTVPARKPIKACYIRNLVSLADVVRNRPGA